MIIIQNNLSKNQIYNIINQKIILKVQILKKGNFIKGLKNLATLNFVYRNLLKMTMMKKINKTKNKKEIFKM